MRRSLRFLSLALPVLAACGSIDPASPSEDALDPSDEASSSLVSGAGCAGAVVCSAGQAVPQCAAASQERSFAFDTVQYLDVPTPASVSILRIVARRLFTRADGQLTAELRELAPGATTLAGSTLRGTSSLAGSAIPRTNGVVSLAFVPAVPLSPRTGSTPRYAVLLSVTGGTSLSVGLGCATTGTALADGWAEQRKLTGLLGTPVNGPTRKLARDLSLALGSAASPCEGVPGATCDDGNGADGDGCSSACQVESGYTCEGTPSACADREQPRWHITPTPFTGWVVDSDTATDPVTGLVWERRLASPYADRAEVLAYCDGLVLAGHADWRLPTRHELATIADHSRDSPAISLTAFPDTPPQYPLWSSSMHLQYPTNSWMLAAFLGTSDITEETTYGYPAKCVRAGNAGPVLPRFTAGTDTVVDGVTGLTWQRATAPGGYDHTGALAYCAALSLAGFTDWRLPSARELESLVDMRRNGPAIDTAAFPDTPGGGWYRSSSTFFRGAYSIYFGDGQLSPQEYDYVWLVRCVR